jgi:hypothetical protein
VTVCSSQSGALGTWGWFPPAASTLSESPGRIAAGAAHSSGFSCLSAAAVSGRRVCLLHRGAAERTRRGVVARYGPPPPMGRTTFTKRKGARVAITNRTKINMGAVRHVCFVWLRKNKCATQKPGADLLRGVRGLATTCHQL